MHALALTLLTAASLSLAASANAASAKENWDLHCAKCHAPDGSGNTKVGQRLKLKDYSKPELQAAFTDAEALAAIRDGIKDASGRFTMNPYAEKLSPAEIDELVPFVRSLKK